MEDFSTDNTFQHRLSQIEKITRKAAERVDALVFSCGHLAENDPERIYLNAKVREVLSEWADVVETYGAIPGDLWSVYVPSSKGQYVLWQYPHSRFEEAHV